MTNVFNTTSRNLMPGTSSLQRGGLSGSGSGHITPTSVGFPTLSNSLSGSTQPSNSGQVSPNRTRDMFASRQRSGTSELSRLNLAGSFGALGSQRGSIGSSHPGQLGSHGHHHHHNAFSSDPMGPAPPTLDQSEFPSLNYRALSGGSSGSIGSAFGSLSTSSSSNLHGDSSQGQSVGILSGRSPYAMTNFRMNVGMGKQANSEPAEFTMTSEDFPALPGAPGGSETIVGGSSGTSDSSKPVSVASNQDNSVSGYQSMSSVSSLTQSSASTSVMGLGISLTNGPSKNQSASRAPGIQWFPDGRMTNIPDGMLTDQFGIAGLLAFIKTAEADQNHLMLTLGYELTNMGLNLNAQEPLYPSFGGAVVDNPVRPQDMDYTVPSEYRTNARVRDTLAPIKLNRYGEDLLFYIFYMNPLDMLQLAAASELYNREWRYHKEEKAWITRVPGSVPHEKTATYERSTYFFFDVSTWRKVGREFVLEYDKLQDRPPLPLPHALNNTAAPGQHAGPPQMLAHQRLPHPSQQVPPQASQAQAPNLPA
ncbi:unnamed protein product [Notodromas monacha]|uniref:NOT2/NOT3/NOT5 C-terminal domain-containing protein n=1 Tax=Notodromas monacha TaxID=399045 RepID=A0A7R9GAK2_9CRUS|nr:unnamed protein product [Notodromas monacha]CAG0915489.1 unnamed protein product [Notodromas monacha]